MCGNAMNVGSSSSSSNGHTPRKITLGVLKSFPKVARQLSTSFFGSRAFAKVWLKLANLGPNRPQICAILANIGPHVAKFGRRPTDVQVRPNLTEAGRNLPHLADVLPIWAQRGQTSDTFGRSGANSGPCYRCLRNKRPSREFVTIAIAHPSPRSSML